jgi:hypothetical protein
MPEPRILASALLGLVAWALLVAAMSDASDNDFRILSAVLASIGILGIGILIRRLPDTGRILYFFTMLLHFGYLFLIAGIWFLAFLSGRG